MLWISIILSRYCRFSQWENPDENLSLYKPSHNPPPLGPLLGCFSSQVDLSKSSLQGNRKVGNNKSQQSWEVGLYQVPITSNSSASSIFSQVAAWGETLFFISVIPTGLAHANSPCCNQSDLQYIFCYCHAILLPCHFISCMVACKNHTE